MVTTCLVVGCKTRGMNGNVFFTVPQKNSWLQQLWIRACGWPEDFKVMKYHRVCNIHFRSGSLSLNGKLLKGAIPEIMVYGRVTKVWAKSILQDHCYSRLFVDKPVQVSGVDTKPEADKAVVEDEQKDPLEISEARDNNPAPDFVIRNVRTVVETNFNNKQPKAVQSVVIHSCQICYRPFPSQRLLDLVHYKASCSYQCEFCGKDYNLLEYLKTHQMRVHATQKRLQCHLCVKSFCYQSMLNVHLSRRHPEASTAHTCNICNQEFRFLRLLQVHENQVHDAKHELKPKIKLKLGQKENFVCDICDKSFSTSVYMKRHKKVIHEKNGKYSCVHCGKKFGTKTYYDLHLNAVHLKKKSYKCRICQKDFKYPTGVHRHLKKQH